MLSADIVRAESARYTTSLLCIPGLWSAPLVWRGFASYLAHRGWESQLLDVRAVDGGIATRAAAVAAHAASLSAPPVLIGHDVGGVVALAAAARAPAAAVVLLAPVVPGSAPARALAMRPATVVPLLLGRAVPPPTLAAAAPLCGELPPPLRSAVVSALAPDSARVVRDVVRPRLAPSPVAGVPTLVVAGDRDPFLPAPAAAALARTIGAQHEALDGAGHWLLAGPAWQRCVGLVHRWLVQRLGEPLLERYAEATAERDEDAEP